METVTNMENNITTSPYITLNTPDTTVVDLGEPRPPLWEKIRPENVCPLPYSSEKGAIFAPVHKVQPNRPTSKQDQHQISILGLIINYWLKFQVILLLGKFPLGSIHGISDLLDVRMIFFRGFAICYFIFLNLSDILIYGIEMHVVASIHIMGLYMSVCPISYSLCAITFLFLLIYLSISMGGWGKGKFKSWRICNLSSFVSFSSSPFP